MLHLDGSPATATAAVVPPPPAPAMPFLGGRIARLGFLTLTGAFGLNFAAGQFFAPLTESRGWDLRTLSAAAAVNAVVSGLAQPLLGRLIDRIGTRPVVAASLASLGSAYVLMAASQAMWQWLLAYGLLAGIGFAGSSSLAVTVLISRWFVHDRARVLPRVFLGINAGQLTLVPVGGVLIDQAGHRAAYLALGLAVLAVLAPVVALRLVSDPEDVGQHADAHREPPPPTTSQAVPGDALRSRQFWLLALAFGINGWTLYFVLLHLPRFARDLGSGLGAGGGLLAIAAVASASTMLGVSRLVGRWGKRRLVVALFGWRATVLVVATLATTSGQLAVVAAAFGVASFPVIPLVMGLLGDRYGTDVLGGVIGMAFVSHQVCGGLGVFTGGALHDLTGSYDAPLLIAAALLAAGTALLLAVDDTDVPSRLTASRLGVPRQEPTPTSPEGAIAS